MKLPNGYGSVYKLSGNRRKPWVARKTAAWNDKGQPVYIYVGYYRTRGEALQGLAEYNGYKLSSNPSETTLRLVYQALQGLTHHYTGAWKHLEPLYDIPLGSLNLQRIQAVFDRCEAPLTTQKYMKTLLTKCFTYAVRNEMIRPEKAAIVQWIEINAEKTRTVERRIFTKDEIAALWAAEDPYERLPLLMIFSGMRIDELLSLRSDDVDVSFHVRHSKTPSGIREIPIPEKLRPDVEYWKAKGTATLITTKRGLPMSYDSLRRYGYWKTAHLPHDCRHTCATLLAEANIDRRTVNAIMGHKGTDLAEEVYTHISFEAKLAALEKVCH